MLERIREIIQPYSKMGFWWLLAFLNWSAVWSMRQDMVNTKLGVDVLICYKREDNVDFVCRELGDGLNAKLRPDNFICLKPEGYGNTTHKIQAECVYPEPFLGHDLLKFDQFDHATKQHMLLTVAGSLVKFKSKTVATMRLMIHPDTGHLNKRKEFYNDGMLEVYSEILDILRPIGSHVEMFLDEDSGWEIMSATKMPVTRRLQGRESQQLTDITLVNKNGSSGISGFITVSFDTGAETLTKRIAIPTIFWSLLRLHQLSENVASKLMTKELELTDNTLSSKKVTTVCSDNIKESDNPSNPENDVVEGSVQLTSVIQGPSAKCQHSFDVTTCEKKI